MNILVAGGAGYIGSHTIVELLNSGHNVICVDNLSNSSEVAIERVEKITGKKILFYKVDLTDKTYLNDIFNKNKIDACIMFAGLKAVGESNEKPLLYYMNNLISFVNLIEVMISHNCYNIIFSSSATVYGVEAKSPISEESYVGDLKKVTNPYGRTKLMIEQMLLDIAKANDKLKIVILRYFNPVGAHKSGLLGEDPRGIPNNLMPYIAKVAVGKMPKLHIYGNDYNTKDGTGVRDYIHVVDLAVGHVLSLKLFEDNKYVGYEGFNNVYVYNLGTGVGYSVLDVVNTYEKVNNIKIDYVIDGRRPGDVDSLYCNPKKANVELGFNPEYDLCDMCRDSYNFQKNNPNGYN